MMQALQIYVTAIQGGHSTCRQQIPWTCCPTMLVSMQPKQAMITVHDIPGWKGVPMPRAAAAADTVAAIGGTL